MHGRWELSDEQWALLEPILRSKRRPDGKGRPPKDARTVLNGVLWILGTGAQWREMPEKYPPYQTCHRRFQQWVRSGALAKALRKLARRLQAEGRLNLEEAASSTGRCNTSVKSFCRSFKLQRLTGPFVQLTCHLV